MNDQLLSEWAEKQKVGAGILAIISKKLNLLSPDKANELILKIHTENLELSQAIRLVTAEQPQVTAALPAHGKVSMPQQTPAQGGEVKDDRPVAPVSKPVEPGKKSKFKLPNTLFASSKKSEGNGAPGSKSKKNNQIVIVAIAGVFVLILLIMAVLVLPSLMGNGSNQGSDFYSSPTLPGADPSSILVPEAQPTEATVTGSGDYWQSLSQVQPEQKSPGILGYLTALTGFGIFLRLLLGVWGLLDANVRKKNQPAAMLVMCLSIAAGWLTLPILNFLASKPNEAGWFIVGALVLGVVWAIPVAMIWVQKDKTPLTVALSIFVSAVFYAGKMAIVPALGTYFGAIWPLWQGVYSLGGMFALIWGGRAAEAALTMFVYLGGLTVIFLSIQEVGKGKRMATALMTGGIVIGVFLLSSWGIGALFNSLLAGQMNPTVELVVLLAVLRPLLAWVISLVVSIGIGVARGDIEVGGIGENRASQGLALSQYIQNVADFAFLGTVIPLFLGVIMVLI